MMFASFSRRLTIWYVVAAVTLVTVLALGFAAAGLFVYVHLIQDGIDADAREVEAFAARAQARGQKFQDAALEIERRLARPGVRIVAAGPFPRPPSSERARRETGQLVIRPTLPRNGEHGPQQHGRPGDRSNMSVIVDGKVVQGNPRRFRFEGSRLGFALAAIAGARFQRVDFLDGEMSILPDPNATQRVALLLLAAVFGVAALAGILAWFSGRYLTSQVLRPLIEVTHALQRFAARDFTPQPVAVAGKSDFDAIALAYNAAAAQVASAFAEREQAEAQMRQFVADAGHELRTPLTIVLGYIDLLRRRAVEGDERSRRIFASISIEGARMRTLIDNLVLLARMEGEDVRTPEPFELCPMLENIVDSRRVLNPGLQISLDCSVDATVIGDQTEIHEAIANIVDNAIKYAPGSPVRLLARRAEGGVEITIADEGPGIHADDRASIFDRFYRGATRGEVEGSGLGLAIAKRAVERAGGTLVLVSTSPDGTTFALRLRADKVRPRTPRTASA